MTTWIVWIVVYLIIASISIYFLVKQIRGKRNKGKKDTDDKE